MLQAGILASYATDWLGPRNVRKFGVQFREQVWPGDRLVCTGTVIDRDEAARTVDLELVVTRVGGGAAIKGTATFAGRVARRRLREPAHGLDDEAPGEAAGVGGRRIPGGGSRPGR